MACLPRAGVGGGLGGRENQSLEPTHRLLLFCFLGAADVSSAIDHPFSTASRGGEKTCYTSLISDICYPSQEESTYFTGILQKENGHATTSETPEELSTPGPSLPDVPGTEPRGLFSSDSGIEMTPAESIEVSKILADPLDQMKAEAYKYIDITRPEEVKYQEQSRPTLEEKDLDFKNKETEINPGDLSLPCTPNCFQEETFRACPTTCGAGAMWEHTATPGMGEGEGSVPPGCPRKHLHETGPCLFQGRGAEASLNSHHQPREVRKDYWNLPRCKAHVTPLSDLEGSG